jgi:hypothetical protein
MKRNMKKLVVFVVIATIATFISAAIAKDGKGKHGEKNYCKAIHGEYAATSVVSCNNYIPNPDGSIKITSGMATQLAIYTFNGDGTGTLREGKFVMLGITPTPSESAFDFQWDFTYEVEDDGTITMDAVPGTGLFKLPGTDFVVYTLTGGTSSDSGRSSQDHKTIILGTAEPNNTELTLYNGNVFLTKCNASHVLIRVGE